MPLSVLGSCFFLGRDTMNKKLTIILCLGTLAVMIGANNGAAQFSAPTDPAAPLGTAFTYQGYLTDGGSPADGVYDLRFILYDAAVSGSQVGNTLEVADLAVSQGLLMAALNFGSDPFNGEARWLEIAVRPGSSSGAYTALSPRQALTAAPYTLDADKLDGQHAGAFASAIHNHLGETWLGSDNSLVITGTFGAQDRAPLVLYNKSSGSGLRVNGAGLAGVYVVESGLAGVWVSQADAYGVGVYRAGNPSSLSTSTFPAGFEMEGSEGYGLYVGRADMDGVHVFSAGDDGVHVSSAGSDGVYATSTNASAYGGQFVNSATGGRGLYARGGSNTAADLILAGNDASNDDGRIYSDPAFPGSDLIMVSNDAVQIELDNDSNESGNLWVLNGANTTVFAINENGDMTAIGTKSAAVNTQDYGMRTLYVIESPENWFEDFGSSQLVEGAATVAIEPLFSQTVNLNEEYHVFLTPLGDCPLYVAEKTPGGFIVKSIGGQACSISFDYRIVARRLGYEKQRLEPATDLGQDEEQ
jgi:hypothetical protein